MTATTSGLRLRPLRGPDDYPGLTEANQEARAAAGRPSGITVTDLARYLEHLVNCDPARDLVVAEVDGRISGYGIAFWRDLAIAVALDPDWSMSAEGHAVCREGAAHDCPENLVAAYRTGRLDDSMPIEDVLGSIRRRAFRNR